MNFPPANHVTRGNLTLRQLEEAVEAELWEPQTVIVVVIFGLVCFLHLTAFLYTVCLQNYVHAGTQPYIHPVNLHIKEERGIEKCFPFKSPWLTDSWHSPQREKAPIMIDM